jgi:transcriptional regulator with XRE-family HTH domain
MKKLLKKIREDNGLTQKEMGIILMVGNGEDKGQSFVCQMEGGLKAIPLRVIYKLPRIFNLTKPQIKQINDYLQRIV